MPRTDLTVQQVSRDGLDPTYTAANVDGHAIAPAGTIIHVKNGDTTAKTITFLTVVTVVGLSLPSLEVTVPASGERMFGPFPEAVFGQSDGKVHVNFSAVTAVTVAAFRLG